MSTRWPAENQPAAQARHQAGREPGRQPAGRKPTLRGSPAMAGKGRAVAHRPRPVGGAYSAGGPGAGQRSGHPARRPGAGGSRAGPGLADRAAATCITPTRSSSGRSVEGRTGSFPRHFTGRMGGESPGIGGLADDASHGWQSGCPGSADSSVGDTAALWAWDNGDLPIWNHIALVDAAIGALPPGFRRRLMITCDGAGGQPRPDRPPG